MNLYFMPTAAAAFVRLDEPSAGAVLNELAQNSGTRKAFGTSTPELLRQVKTSGRDLWLGAFAEAGDLTLLTLGEKLPHERFHERAQALLRAKRRLVLGGVSLDAGVTEMLDTIHALLEEQRAIYSSVLSVGARGGTVTLDSPETSLFEQLARSAHRWRSTPARRDFKSVMQEAAVAPQVIERDDGREVVIIDRELLKRFEQPLSGAALAARFARNDLPYLSFGEVIETEPDPSFELPSRA